MIKRIPIEKVEVGMYLVGLDKNWVDTPFLFHKFKIRATSEIDRLKKYHVKFIDIDTEKGLDHQEAVPVNDLNERLESDLRSNIKNIDDIYENEEEEPVPFNEEIETGKKIHDEVKRCVNDIMNDIKIGKNIDAVNINNSVSNMIDSLDRNKNALVTLARLKNFDEYTFHHSLNVSILALAFGKHLGYPREDLQIMGTAGLLHDIGKIKIPQHIFNKPGVLTDEEFLTIKKHVEYGVDILSKEKSVSDKVITMVFQHHERYNGTGYPKQLLGGNISIHGLIGGIVDVFDALTSERVYKRANLPFEGLREIYKMQTQFPKFLLEKFIQCMGIFPVGSLVELNTKDIAIVVEINHKDLMKPKIKLVFNRHRNRYADSKIIDLTDKTVDGNTFARKIIGIADPKSLGIDPANYITLLTQI